MNKMSNHDNPVPVWKTPKIIMLTTHNTYGSKTIDKSESVGLVEAPADGLS